jgi:TonB family protein
MVLLVLLSGSRALALSSQEKAAEDGAPFRVGEGVSRPEKISGAPPVYPEAARKARVTGTVIVEAIIDEQGDVTNARVLRGRPMGLDQAALEAVQSWKFKPAMFQGKPVKVYYTLTVNFKVEKSPDYGPVFQGFLTKHPDFANHLGSKRYQEAAALLDRWGAERPEDSEIPLARIYLLLEQGQLDEAWKMAVAVRGPESYEVLDRVGAVALDRVVLNPLLNPETRAKVIDLGLLAETLAMEARQDGYEALLNKSLLLLEKSKLTSDPAERQALQEEIRRLMRLYAEIRKPSPSGPEERQE